MSIVLDEEVNALARRRDLVASRAFERDRTVVCLMPSLAIVVDSIVGSGQSSSTVKLAHMTSQ